MKLFVSVFVFFFASIALHAQQFDYPVSVPITYYGMGVSTMTGGGSFSFGSELGATCSARSYNPGAFVYSSVQNGSVTPGKTYNVTVSSSNLGYGGVVVIYFQPINGCALYINGVKTTTVVGYRAGTNYSFQVRVVVERTSDELGFFRAGLPDKRAGECSSFVEDKAFWFIGLGRTRNGQSAGGLGIRAAWIESSLFTSAALQYYAEENTEATITYEPGTFKIASIQSREVVLNVTTLSSTSYKIDACRPETPTTPFITYTISQYAGGAGIRIDKLEDSITLSTALKYENSTWTRYDWQKSSVFPAGNITTTVANVLTSTVTTGSGAGSIVKQKNYAFVANQVELTSVVMGPGVTSAPTTSYSYYPDASGTGWPRALKWIIEPTGKWTKYDYFNSLSDTRAGKIQRIYRPWQDTPATPSSATTANCYVETYDYAANYDGIQCSPSSKIVTINGITIGKTTWAYNWNIGTVNTHKIAQITQNAYSSAASYLTTTTLSYRDDDSASFFCGRLHAVTRPDGTKDSYAYYFGTWDASSKTFSPGTGEDRLILCLHGQAGAGTGASQITSWTLGSSTWDIAPLYLVSNLSTVSETVVDTNGRTAFTAENIYTGSGIERITAHAYTYNNHNLLVADKDVIRSVSGGEVSIGYAYEVGLPKTTTDVDGVQTSFHYDDYLRNDSITTAATGAVGYPATTQSFTYYSSGLKYTAQEAPRSPVTTTYTYETSGRVATSSQPKPGGGTLTTSYAYPSSTQTTVTLPTNATKTTAFYLDGRRKEMGGTGQYSVQFAWNVDSSSGNITKTTQNGSSTANGWVEEKTDWLGRTVTQRMPQWGWTNGSDKVVCKTSTYDSATGQLKSISTTDESSSARLVPDHLYSYGNLGIIAQEGDDINQSGSLELGSNDVITALSTSFYKDGGWIRDEEAKVYRTSNSSADIATSHKYTRFTQFNNGALLNGARVLSDVEVVDASGRSETIMEWSDSAARTRSRSDSVQGATNAAVTTWQDGYLKSEVSASGVTTSYAYDNNGLLCDQSNNMGGKSIWYHSGTNFASSMDQTAANENGVTTTSYGYSWNTTTQTSTVSITDDTNSTAYTEYDAKGQVIHTWGTSAQPVKTEYDDYGRRTAITTWQSGSFAGSTWPATDPTGGNRVYWTPDPATGAANSKTDAANKTVNFTYNALGQLTTRKWARDVTTTYSYYSESNSQLGKLKSVTYSDGTPTVSYTYNRFGAIDTVTDAAGTRTYNYRSDLKLDNEAFDSSFYGSKTLTTIYDTTVPGRVNGYSFNGSNYTVSATAGYDPTTGRVNSVTGGFVISTTFNVGYAPGTNWVNSVTNGSYNRSTPIISGSGVIDSATTSWGGVTMAQFKAHYDDVRGLRTGQDSGSTSGTTAGSWSKVLGLGDGLHAGTNILDGFGQLTSMPTPSWQAAAGSQSLSGRNFGWTYDLAGNRLSETGAAPTSYTPNALNQYSSITGVLWEGSPLYDDDGNMTVDATWVYTYDGENRLHSMARAGQTLTFAYDYTGRRIRKTVTGTNASDTKFLWNGWKLVAELAVDGTTVNRTFVWGQDFSDAQGGAGGAGSLLAQIDNGVVTYAVPDVFGNIVGYLNSSGVFHLAVEYSPYGRVLSSAGSVASHPIGYSGQYTDWETGLVYYGHRYYSPKHGRFINRDPIEEAGGLNLYAFCQNRPTGGWDTLGFGFFSSIASIVKSIWDIIGNTSEDVYLAAADWVRSAVQEFMKPGNNNDRNGSGNSSERFQGADGKWHTARVSSGVTMIQTESGGYVPLGSSAASDFAAVDYFAQYDAGRASGSENQDVRATFPLSEANKVWRSKVGGTVRIDVKDLGITPLKSWFHGTGDENAVTVPSQHNWNVYGDVDLVLGEDGLVRVQSELYDFDQKPSNGTFSRWMRNVLTSIGEWKAGDGSPFTTEFVGTMTPVNSVPYQKPSFIWP